MAFAGYTWIDRNRGLLLPAHDLVYDWLSARKVKWRVYHHGLPFFMMLENWCTRVVLDPKFRSFDSFGDDWRSESAKKFPQVIFLEPRYADAPHFEPPNDDHPPVPVAAGQQFLLRIFSDLMTNPERWSRTALIITYDEHGGFFDHVPPEAVRTDPPRFPGFIPFESTGVRVPGIIVSPFVEPGSVCHDRLDHTSMLKFLGAKFGGGNYTPIVDARPVGDLTSAFTRSKPRTDLTVPGASVKSGFVPSQEPSDAIPQAFKAAVMRAMKEKPAATREKFPELFSHFAFKAAPRKKAARKKSSPRRR
jgi:phospholipase C